MLRRSPAALALAALLLGPPAALAAPGGPAADPSAAVAATPSPARVDALMKALRLDLTAEKLSTAMTAGMSEEMARSGGAMAPEVVTALETAAAARFAPELIESRLAARLADSLSADDVETLTARALTPLHQRALDGEHAHDAVADRAGFGAFAARLGQGPDDAERLRAVATIAEEVRLAERFGGVMVDMQKVMLHGAANADPYASPGELDALLDRVERQREPTVAMLAQMMPVMLAWSYEDLSLVELRALARDAGTPVSKRLDDALMEGLRDVMMFGAAELADDIVKAVRTVPASARI